MARARNIKPAFFANEDLAALEPHARLLFVALWCLADRAGRLEYRPKRIAAFAFPYEPIDCEALLAALDGAGFIRTYEVNGLRCIEVLNFGKHQRPHVKEQASVLPAPELETITKNVACREKDSACRSDSLNRIPDTPTPIPLFARGKAQ
jgi:hypothetical protein